MAVPKPVTPVSSPSTAFSNGQSLADLSGSAGISQQEALTEQMRIPGLNPDAIVGNILSSRRMTAPIVSTAKTAVDDLTKKNTVIQTNQAMIDGQNAKLAADAAAKATTPPPDNGTITTNPDGTTTTTQPLQGKFDAANKAFQDSLDSLNKKSDDATTDFVNKTNQMLNGTFPLSPDQQNQINMLQQQFQQLIDDQKKANENYTNAVTKVGINAGRNIYAPEVELGNIKQTVDEGLQKISTLNQQMTSAITTAKMAFENQNFELFNSAYQELQDATEQRKEDVKLLFEKTQQQILNVHSDLRDQQEFEFKVEEALNKPMLELEQSTRDHIFDLGLKFPGAGIDATDSIPSATEKLLADPLYQATVAKLQADAALEASGGQVTDATIRSFAQSLLQSGAATTPFEADKMARDYFATGAVPETTSYGVGSQAILEGAGRLASRNSEAQQGALMRGVNKKLQAGDIIGATTDVYTNAYASLPAQEQQRAFGYIQGLNDLDDIESLLVEYKNAGGDTGLLVGSAKKIANALKTSGNPIAEDAGNRIVLAMSNYRKAQSGAAFTEAEEKLYKDAFPSLLGTESFNVTKIKSLRDSFNTGLKSQLQTTLGPETYDKMNILRVAKSAGYELSDVEELLKRGKTPKQIQEIIEAPESTGSKKKTVSKNTGGESSSKFTVNNKTYDMSTYAADPHWGTAVNKIIKGIGKIDSDASINNYIKKVSPNSKMDAGMIKKASQQYNVPPEMIMAILQHEGKFGTSNVAVKNNNPGGVTWSKRYEESHPGTKKGSPRPAAEGGNYVLFDSMLSGVASVAEQISKRAVA